MHAGLLTIFKMAFHNFDSQQVTGILFFFKVELGCIAVLVMFTNTVTTIEPYTLDEIVSLAQGIIWLACMARYTQPSVPLYNFITKPCPYTSIL